MVGEFAILSFCFFILETFLIILEFQKGLNRANILNKVKDAVTITLPKLPKDMDEPVVQLMDRSKELVDLALTSNTKSVDEMQKSI